MGPACGLGEIAAWPPIIRRVPASHQPIRAASFLDETRAVIFHSTPANPARISARSRRQWPGMPAHLSAVLA